jgi:hypothetical protein
MGGTMVLFVGLSFEGDVGDESGTAIRKLSEE